jgi:squalene-hopene/tetraprenyl-beta-curcumene cyclase
MLVQAAFEIVGVCETHRDCVQRLEDYLTQRCGRTANERAAAIRNRYGKDRTFSIPILTNCALAGLVDWRQVTPLPFELACFPQSWFRFLRLPVVSYALPALIGIGQAIHHHRPPWNPMTQLMRHFACTPTLRALQRIQPTSGGFLEATPLTSFVTMSLASIGLAEHPVTRKGVEFLVASVRPDGSWPIDSNLATWVTTLTINALANYPRQLRRLLADDAEKLRAWLIAQQGKERHPYTGAAPGAWAWTPLSGGVPDADDTPGAILALTALGSDPTSPPIVNGIAWLLALQNRDGGWPTFCKGWGLLPFDRSGADLTAHALRALAVVRTRDPKRHKGFAGLSVEPAIERGLRYLARQQRRDGSWIPLWFGNQHAPHEENPTYGTARVLAAYRALGLRDSTQATRGVNWLLAAQNPDGGWGGNAHTPSSVEESALAVEALLDYGPHAQPAVTRGLAWLLDAVERGNFLQPAPIGFYFANLWYFEKLYPIIFTVAALGRACACFDRADSPY